MNLTFTGGRELARLLRQLPEVIAAQLLQASLMAGGEIIRARAQEKCPKPAERRRPGTVRLSDSIRVSLVEKNRAHAVVNVGTNVPYAHLVEFGHQIVARGPNRGRISVTTVSAKGRVSVRSVLGPAQAQTRGASGMVAARPFLRPAFDETKELVTQRIGEVLGRGIEAEAKRLATMSAAA